MAAVTAAFGLYSKLSLWQWQGADSGASATAVSTEEINALQKATSANPKNLNSWLALAEAYLKNEQYAAAAKAFENANQPGSDNVAALTGLAESLALDGDSNNDARVEPLFNRALQLDPKSPKALLYLGLAALRGNDLPTARAHFATMLTLGDAPASVREALEKQIAAIDAELQPKAVDAATAVKVTVSVAQALKARYEQAATAGATLFVFVRNPAGGAPLAVKRLAATLPQTITLSAADAMIAGNAIQPGQKVSVLARLSASGTPTESTGDLYGKIDYVAGKNGQQSLVIDHVTP
jgi:cytochrome c-type biogenesis protein CcmH